MRCMRSSQLNAYLHDELLPTESLLLEEHVERCTACQRVLAQFGEAGEELHILGDIPPLPDTFTLEVASKIPELMTLAPVQREQRQAVLPKQTIWKKRSAGILKKIAIGVAVLAVAISLGTFVSPTFANYVKSLFRTDEKVDTGLQKAAEHGFSHPIGQKVTNQGITVEVKEVLADPTRIALILDVRDADGKKGYVRLEDLVNTHNTMDVRDKEGNSIMSSLAVADHEEYAIVQFNVADPSLDQLVVLLDYGRIGKRKGNWQLHVPIDMKKAKEALKTIAIDNQYTSPQGLIIQLKTLELAPSLTRLTLETNLAQQVMKEKKIWLEKERQMRNNLQPALPSDVIAQYQIAYELVDEKGTVVAAQGLAGDETANYAGGFLSKINTNPSTGGLVESNEFFPLPHMQKLLFRLRAVYVNEPAKLSAKLNLQDVKNQPVFAKDTAGNSFAFTGFAWNEEKAGEGSAGAYQKAFISFEATLVQDVIPDHFSAVCDGNKESPVQLHVAGKKLNADGSTSIHGTLEVWADKQEWGKKPPQEITISYDRLTKRYRDVNWEVPINLH